MAFCLCVHATLCVCVCFLGPGFVINRPIFLEAVLHSAGCRIDGVREEERGERARKRERERASLSSSFLACWGIFNGGH